MSINNKELNTIFHHLNTASNLHSSIHTLELNFNSSTILNIDSNLTEEQKKMKKIIVSRAIDEMVRYRNRYLQNGISMLTSYQNKNGVLSYE